MKYSGKLGIAQQVEDPPGVWDEVITERNVIGDLKQRSETLTTGESVLPRRATTTSVSLLAFGGTDLDHSTLRYLTQAGKRWAISSIVADPPEIVLYFGEEYHGPTPE